MARIAELPPAGVTHQSPMPAASMPSTASELPLDPESWQPAGPLHRLTNGFSRETAPRAGPDATLVFARPVQEVEIYSVALDPVTGKPAGDLTPETADDAAAILPAGAFRRRRPSRLTFPASPV